MTETEYYNISSENENETTEKRIKFRAQWRHNPDGTYNNKPIDKEYFKRYYDEKLKDVKVLCDQCGFMCSKTKYRRHQRSAKCLQIKAFVENKLNLIQKNSILL